MSVLEIEGNILEKNPQKVYANMQIWVERLEQVSLKLEIIIKLIGMQNLELEISGIELDLRNAMRKNYDSIKLRQHWNQRLNNIKIQLSPYESFFITKRILKLINELQEEIKTSNLEKLIGLIETIKKQIEVIKFNFQPKLF